MTAPRTTSTRATTPTATTARLLVPAGASPAPSVRAALAAATTARLAPGPTARLAPASSSAQASSSAPATSARAAAPTTRAASPASAPAAPAAPSTRATRTTGAPPRPAAPLSWRGRIARRALPAAGAALLLGGLVVAALAPEAPGAGGGRVASSTVAAPIVAGAPLTGPASSRSARMPGHAGESPAAASDEHAHLAAVELGSHDAPAGAPSGRAGAVGGLEALAAARAQALERGHDHDAHDEELEARLADEAMAAIVTGLKADPAALVAAIDHLRATDDPADAELLAALLGRVGGPLVEGAALELAAKDAQPWRRAAAFDLLDALDAPAAVPVALQALGGERDIVARRAAVHALPLPVGVTRAQSAEVVTTLARVAHADADPEVRRRAAIALGDWARRPEDLASVVAGLTTDPSIDVRAGCAFACELAARASDARMRAALVQAMSKADEDPLVRENAWRALGAAGPLEESEHLAWTAYAAARAR